jgi:opacity protein-like surface antigen
MKKYIIKSKILLLLIGIISITTNLSAQQSSLTFDASQLYTSFNFTDSLGTKLNSEYSGIYTGAYNVGYNFTLDFGLFFHGGIGMRKAGATMVYDDINYMWNLQYTDVKLGVGYIYNENRFKPYFNSSSYFAYLLKANQSLNNENFDILKSKSISNIDFGVLITPGLKVEINKTISVFTEFTYLMGLKNLESSNNAQKSFNKGFGFSLGLSFNLNETDEEIEEDL